MSGINSKRVILILLLIIAVLLLLHTISYINFYVHELSPRDFFFRKFNFAEEKNVPSTFSSALHLIASILLFWIAFSNLKIRKNSLFWISLGILFLFLCLDELLRLHERVGGFTSRQIDTSGVFYYSWVIPYGIAVILLGLLYLRPLLRLPKLTIRNFCIAGIIFLSGAVGLEMAAGFFIDTNQIAGENLHTTIPIFVLYTFEELFEMLGVSFFIYELFRFKEHYVVKKTS